VSRITSGKITLARQPLDLAALAWRCVEMQTPGGPAVSLRTPHEPIVVDGDPVRLEQVLGNLLDNARKYTPAGGHVRVIVERDGAHARLVVEDDGIGIAPEVLPRIFEPFAQAGAPVGQRQGGLGLGLTLVQRLVEQHGGTVGAASDGPGRGSRFVVTLPRTEGVPVDQAPAPAPAQSPSPRRILLVEDNRDAREALRALLEVWGHRVETAADGPSGLAAALADPPEVALVDVGLPGLDGHELARRLRAAPGGAGVFLVALTGYGQPEDERLALAAGFDVHVVKPVEPAELVRLLARPPARAAPRQPSAAARSGSSSR
jgi:CheY-like chemotaxis protein